MPHKNNFARTLCGLLIACLFPCFLARGAAASAPELGEFPAIQATTLDGTRMKLPQDFAGQLNLVIISFAREQQHDVDTWVSAAKQMQAGHSKFSFYELPTTSRDDLLYRWWFDSALRSNTSDKELRTRTLTAYVSKRNFHKTLHIADEKHVVAVLVDRTGKVYWRAEGAMTEQDTAALQATLAANGV